MKALKEKRISLRSLWRRGLVILSLFALVFAFAACSDSDNGGGDSGGLKIVKIEQKEGAAEDQYLGKPINLKGVELYVYYTDGHREPVTDISQFTAYPRVFTGTYAENDPFDFKGMPKCVVSYKGIPTEVSITGKAWGIVKTNAKVSDTVDGTIWGTESEYYSMGLNLTGTAAKEAFADDDHFDFSGLTLMADYFYRDPITRDILRDKGYVSFSDITYKIVPSYKDAKGVATKGDSTGYVAITVGEDVYRYLMKNNEWPAGRTGVGVTTTHMLDTVHIITGIKLAKAAEFKDYYYWQPNTRDAWLDRLGDEAQLVVSYSGGKPDRTFYIKDLKEKARIWWNDEAGKADKINTEYRDNVYFDFDIVPLQYPFTVKANPEPGIVLYYRGAPLKVPVDVFTTLLSVSAVGKDGGDIRFDPSNASDNDIREGLPGAQGLAALLTVTATYQAYNDANKQSNPPLPLEYKGNVNEKLERHIEAWDGNGEYEALEYIPYYTFDKATADESSYDKVWGKWRAAVIKDKKAEIVAAVTVGHSVREYDFYTAAARDADREDFLPTFAGLGEDSSVSSRFCVGTYEGRIRVTDDGRIVTSLDADGGKVYANTAVEFAYPFADAPYFVENLKRVANPDVYQGDPAMDGTRGWTKILNPLAEAGTSGSGVKQPPKARTDKPTITWVVKD